MTHGMIRKAAIAAFVASMAIAGSAAAKVPNIACTPALQGRVVTTQSSTHRFWYQCNNGTWYFVRMCPLSGGGPCAV